MKDPDIKEILEKVEEIALDKKAFDYALMDVGEKSSVTDYFICLSCHNERQMKAVAKEIEVSLKQDFKWSPFHGDGKADSGWMVLDYGNIIIHLLLEDIRKMYDLDELFRSYESKGKQN